MNVKKEQNQNASTIQAKRSTTKKGSRKNPMKFVIEMFLEKDIRSLAMLFGKTTDDFERLRTGLVKEEITPKELKHCQLGRMVVACDVLSAMLDFLEKDSKTNSISAQESKTLYA